MAAAMVHITRQVRNIVVDVFVDGTVPTAAYLPVKIQARMGVGLAQRCFVFPHCVTKKRTPTPRAQWVGMAVVAGKHYRLLAHCSEDGRQTIQWQK